VTRQDIANDIIKTLKKQEKEEGKLPLLLEFYRKLLTVQAKIHKRLPPSKTRMSREAINKRIYSGQPLLNADELAFDWPQVQDAFERITTVFSGYPELFGKVPDKLRHPGAGQLLTRKAVQAWFAGKKLPEPLTKNISENLIQAIIQATMQPFLSGYAEVLYSSIEQDHWHRTYCPVCGGRPDFASLRKDVGARWLLCSRCDSEWSFPRLQCPYCGNLNQKDLTFYSDEDGLYLLYVCEKCKGYIKAIDLRKASDDVMLPLERILTVEMDQQARSKGYSLPD
jgi:FdhE protein